MAHSGIVRFYNVKNSYGFIGVEEPQPGNDIFVHKTGIIGNILKEGDKVSFEITTDENGRTKASNVTGGSGMTFEEAEERYRNRRTRFSRGGSRGGGRGRGRGRGRGFDGGYNDNYRGGDGQRGDSRGDNGGYRGGDNNGYQGRDNNSGGGYRDNSGFNSRPRGPPGICFQFRDTGSCRFDQDCRFSHDLSGASEQPQQIVQQPQETHFQQEAHQEAQI